MTTWENEDVAEYISGELDEGEAPSFADLVVKAIADEAPLEFVDVVEEEYTDEVQKRYEWKVTLDVTFSMFNIQDQADFLEWLSHIENPWLVGEKLQGKPRT
jgi:hypothetical protein